MSLDKNMLELLKCYIPEHYFTMTYTIDNAEDGQTDDLL
jgi:hypothetical protein